MRVYGLYDELTGFQEQLTTFHNDQEAVRNFAALVNDQRSQLNLWHGDYSIWFLGEIEKGTGIMKQEKPQLLIRGSSVYKKQEEGKE